MIIMYGINEKVYENLLKYFRENQYIKRVILFGSRAKGNYNYNSDIDLCVECERKFRSNIIDSIDDIVGIYSVDVLFFSSLNPEIKNQIDKYGKEIYVNEKS